jgi:glycosyltransferase involved in cell wall biosynthesis
MGKGKKKAKKTTEDDIDAFLNQQIKLNQESTPVQNSHHVSNKKNGNNKKKIDRRFLKHPNVSICTPTFNRRPFFDGLINCIAAQDYPQYKIEWIVVDDGTDCVRDIFESEETKEKLGSINVRYFYESEKMDLGKKRNYMHEKCQFRDDDDIIVYMDDDDFYPKERVSHSVEKLMKNPKALCGGSSEIYLWFNTLDKMYKFGPYGPNHATAGTFAFRRKLLKDTSYENDAVLAEERHFLKDYTIPFVQFDPLKTILVFSHEQNTFDKRRLINDKNKFCNESTLKVSHFIKDKNIESFYKTKIGELLKSYEPGDVKNKPKVLDEIARRDKERQDMVKNKPSGIYVTDANTKESKELTMHELNQFILHKTEENKFLRNKLQEMTNEINNLKSIISTMNQSNGNTNTNTSHIDELSTENIIELSKNIIT